MHLGSAEVDRITPGSQGSDTVPEVPGSQPAYSQPRGTRTTPRSSAAGTDRSRSCGGLLRRTSLGGLLSGQAPSTLHDLSPHCTSASAHNVVSELSDGIRGVCISLSMKKTATAQSEDLIAQETEGPCQKVDAKYRKLRNSYERRSFTHHGTSPEPTASC
jgi:hypothetical protein